MNISLHVRALVGAFLVVTVGTLLIFSPGIIAELAARHLIVAVLTFLGVVFHLINTYEARPPRLR
jgi:hypothetical protein